MNSLKFPIDKSSHRNFMSSESFFPNPSCHVTPPGNFCWKIAEPPTWCYPNVWVGKVHLGICQVLPKTVECDLDLLFGKLGLRKCLPGVKNWMIPPRLGVAVFCQEVSPELGVRVSSFSDFQPMFSRFLFSGEFFEWPFTEVEAWFPLAFLKTRWFFFPPLAASREKKKTEALPFVSPRCWQDVVPNVVLLSSVQKYGPPTTLQAKLDWMVPTRWQIIIFATSKIPMLGYSQRCLAKKNKDLVGIIYLQSVMTQKVWRLFKVHSWNVN